MTCYSYIKSISLSVKGFRTTYISYDIQRTTISFGHCRYVKVVFRLVKCNATIILNSILGNL